MKKLLTLAALLLCAALTGCATADHFPTSPCACDWRLLNSESRDHA